jgi:hypothetical protein
LATVPVSDLEWRPPVPRPGKVICIALGGPIEVTISGLGTLSNPVKLL